MFRNQPPVFQRLQLRRDTIDVQMEDADLSGNQQNGDTDSTQEAAAVNGIASRQNNRLVIAIDFGTTFSSVAYISIERARSPNQVRPENVLCIDHYPNIPAGSISASLLEANENVPTELWYVDGGVEDPDSNGDVPEVDVSGYWSDSPDESGDAPSDIRERLATRQRHQSYLWGYGVHAALLNPGRYGDRNSRVQRFKLMLDFNGEKTKDIKRGLAEQTKVLKHRKTITCKEQMISDYLEQLLRHAKRRLRITGELRSGTQIEFVLCVPNLWSEMACRIMHDCTATAITAAEFGELNQDCIDNLFIVAEPEGAAEFVLSSFLDSGDISPGETFVLLDAGGGTVDATTYNVTRTDPIRLEKQAIAPGGDLYGSSFLNDRYRNRLKERLQAECLPFGDSGFNDFVDHLVTAWENGEKRNIDVTNPRREPNEVYIPGLTEKPEKDFRTNYMSWSRDEMKAIFKPVIRGVVDILKGQLDEAKDPKANLNITKVVLIGGFSDSPSLVQVLRSYLATEQNLRGYEIKLLVPPNLRASAVARGAVLRALRKEHGPERRSRSSFGFLRTELYNHEFPPHVGVKVKKDPVDGLDSVDNTIYWVIQKDQLLDTVYYSEMIDCWHTFRVSEDRLICREELYVADEKKESHYRLANRKKNAGAKLLSFIEIDMTYMLHTNPPLQPVTPNVPANAPNANRKHYRIEFSLIMIVEDRNLRFEVRYPKDSKQVCKSAQVSMAPAFAPGTA